MSQPMEEEAKEYYPGDQLLIIVTDSITDEQRDKVHEVVKANAIAWWHYFANTWLVIGHNAEFWQDALAEPLRDGAAAFMALELRPNEPGRGAPFAGYGLDPDRRFGWLHKHWPQSKPAKPKPSDRPGAPGPAR